jgi:L-lactate dehydrogenase complex protein LldG
VSNASRDAIFTAMRAATAAHPRAELHTPRPRYAAPALSASVETFAASLDAAGGRLVRCEARALADTLARIPGFASAEHVWSSLPVVAPCGLTHWAPLASEDSVSLRASLAALEFALLRGELAVAENGAVWHAPSSPLERAAALLAEHLVLVVPESSLVATLHDAYARIDAAANAFGWFLAGPSKTADIEQALVLGAHGPCAETVVLVSGFS